MVKLTAGEQHPMTACEALDPDIRTQANDFPFVTAARMRLAKAHPVIDLQVGKHAGIISHVIMTPGGCLPDPDFSPMLGLDPITLVSRLITLVIALTFHEFAHAWSATRYGDDTPYIMGRLTLNPLRHLDIVGSLMLVVVGFGWAKPVPVNPAALERRSHSAFLWVSLAGPFSNFLLAIAASLIFRVLAGATGGGVDYFLYEFITINLLLWIFNLIPIPPLDGEKLLLYFLPGSAAPFYAKYRQFGPLVLVALVVILPFIGLDLFGSVISPFINQFTLFLMGV